MKVLLIALVVFIVYVVLFRKKSKATQVKPITPPKYNRQAPTVEINTVPAHKRDTVTATTRAQDDSDNVIDVSGEVLILNTPAPGITKYNGIVPYWAHQYVYSHVELQVATKNQKEFY